MFDSLSIHNWRQYANVHVTFHPRLTVLTGANGSGKTTLLQLLNRHWGWNSQFVSTPRFDRKGVRTYWTGFWEGFDEDLDSLQARNSSFEEIGHLTYSDGRSSKLRIPQGSHEKYEVQIDGMPQVRGVFVPSHRSPYVYQRVEQIPTVLDAKEQIFQTYLNELMARFNTGGRTQSPSFRIKTSLISLATFGYGNQAVQANPDAIRIFEGFEDVLRRVLPESLGFRRLVVRVPDVILDTSTGDFSFDAVSGGVAAIIDLAWQIFMYRQLNEQFVVVIDEPETHLHPALQQRLLPDLIDAFPSCQFIVATHNPFMVASVPDANVYVFTYNDARRVESARLEQVNMAGTPDEILRTVLGVPSTSPRWATERLQQILKQIEAHPITAESLEGLRAQMADIGLQHLFPSTVARVLEEHE